MDATHVELWRKICAFELDGAGDALTFTQRLAHENGWSLRFARRVVEEYKRFVFLAMTAGHEVTPSDAVDQAWHLHLLYTRSYWDGLCRGVLGRPLHHGPTKGGRDETLRFAIQYQETLSSYRESFGEEPPADVWPHGDSTPVRKPRFKRINVAESWVVPKPWSTARELIRKSTSGAAFCVAPVVIAIANPLDLKGPEFLVLYPSVVAVALLVAYLIRHALRTDEDSSRGELTPYQIACVSGGVAGVVRAAIVSLIDRKAVEIVKSKTGIFGRSEYRLKNRSGVGDTADDVDKHILAASNTPEGCYLIDAVRAAEPAAQRIRDRLETWGLLTPTDRITGCQLVPFLIMLAVSGLGIAKIAAGISRGKPVEFLLVMVLVTIFFTAAFLRRPLQTRAGDAKLTQIREQHRPLIDGRVGKATQLSGDSVVLAAALFGLPAIAIGEFASMPDAWKYRGGPNASYSGDGCGSSGCGSSGCGGGGGCGGGCGGCGGD